MGVCQSAAASRPSDLSKQLEEQLVKAIILVKQRYGASAPEASNYNQLLLQFPAMRPGFLRVQELFALLAPEHQLYLPIKALKQHAPTIGLDPEQELLKPIFQIIDGSLSPQELIMVFTIAYLTGKDSPATKDINPDIKACLDIVEKAFLSIESSGKGFLTAHELKATIKSKRKVVGSKHHHKEHPGIGKLLYRDLPCDKSGNVTFKEFLQRIQKLVMSEIVDMDEMQELGDFASMSRASSLAGHRLVSRERSSATSQQGQSCQEVDPMTEALTLINRRTSHLGTRNTPEPWESLTAMVQQVDSTAQSEAEQVQQAGQREETDRQSDQPKPALKQQVVQQVENDQQGDQSTPVQGQRAEQHEEEEQQGDQPQQGRQDEQHEIGTHSAEPKKDHQDKGLEEPRES